MVEVSACTVQRVKYFSVVFLLLIFCSFECGDDLTRFNICPSGVLILASVTQYPNIRHLQSGGMAVVETVVLPKLSGRQYTGIL